MVCCARIDPVGRHVIDETLQLTGWQGFREVFECAEKLAGMQHEQAGREKRRGERIACPVRRGDANGPGRAKHVHITGHAEGAGYIFNPLSHRVV